MDDAIVTQVKIRRKDVYDAVRNLLINEFKVLPEDLTKAVEKKIENILAHTVSDIISKGYGWNSKVESALRETMKRLEADSKKIAEDAVKELVKTKLNDMIIKDVLTRLVGSS